MTDYYMLRRSEIGRWLRDPFARPRRAVGKADIGQMVEIAAADLYGDREFAIVTGLPTIDLRVIPGVMVRPATDAEGAAALRNPTIRLPVVTIHDDGRAWLWRDD